MASTAGFRGALICRRRCSARIVAVPLLLARGARPVGAAPRPATAARRSAPARVLLSPAVISLTGLFALLSLSSGAITTFSVVALVALYGVQLSAANAALSAYLMATAIGVLAGGFVADATRRHAEVAAAGFGAAAAITFTIGTFDLGVVLLLPAMAAAGFLAGMIMPSRDMLVRAAAPPGMTGRVFGIVTTGFNIGGTIGPMLGGWFMDNGEPRWIFYSSVCFMLADRADGPGRRLAVAPAGARHGIGSGGVDDDERRTRSDEERTLIDLAQRVLPAGSFGNLAGDIVIREGRGGRVWDVSGNEYVDFLLGSGPMFVGHCHPDVMAAVQAQIPRGTTFFANNEHGIRLAAAIVDAVACAEKVRFVSQRHRGRRLRHARRPRVPWPRQDPQVRGRLSRHERLQPDEPGAEAPRQLPAGGAGLAWHPAQRARRDDHRAVQRSGDGGQPDPRAPRRTGRRHRRAVPAPAAAEARLPAGAARRDAQSMAFR